VYVSHTVGDAALGLLCVQGKLLLEPDHQTFLIKALEKPVPRVELGHSLLSIANSCLDVSDGLIGDLSHICERSDVSIELDVEQIPLSDAYQAYHKQGGDLGLALNGGDDYELAFTASVDQRNAIDALSQKSGLVLSRIGRVTPASSIKVSLLKNGQPFTLPAAQSFEHFS
jgi:thiamine-monophosphate kinase